MAEINCSACEDIREASPEFIINGLTDDICTSLANNTGMNPTDENDTCTDLSNLNDCLVGNMETELKSYDSCDWKNFMKNFIPNLWTTLKAIICSFCGIWAHIKRLECMLDLLFNGADFYFGEETEGKESKLVPGKGVDFTIRSSSDEHAYDIRILFIAGGLARMGGSLRVFTESFKDAKGNTKNGNSVWNFNNADMPLGGELLYEVRIKKSEYPQIKRIYNGTLLPTSGNDKIFQVFVVYFGEGSYAYGQHGWCDADGSPSESGYSSGHKVPEGWMYVQARMMYAGTLTTYDVKDGSGSTKRGTDLTPQGYVGIRMNQNEIEC